MTWTAPPTFADDNVLSASQLNALSDNCEYLYGIVTSANVPFASLKVTGDLDNDPADNMWFIRHKHRYLHWRFQWVTGNDPTQVRIYYDGTQIVNMTGFTNKLDTEGSYSVFTPESGSSPQGALDLNSSPSPTVGNWYTISLETNTGAGDTFIVAYIVESDSTSLSPS